VGCKCYPFILIARRSDINILSQKYKEDLGDAFTLHTAFSRDGPQKVYVQHLIEQNAEELNDLLEKKAYFYVCGDAANMAREVNTLLGKIIAKRKGVDESKGEEIVKAMRASGQYQEDVWS
jgi:NADPH-ferrihemoprotein reductase